MSGIALALRDRPRTAITVTHTVKVSIISKINSKTVIEEFQETKRWTADLNSKIKGGNNVA